MSSATDSTEAFQISLPLAEAYEATFVPALFAQWASDLLAEVAPAPGQSVLDVACGTGVVARAAADRVGPTGRVVGLDLNEAMLTVARRARPHIEWRQGDVAALPFAGGSFDLVLCQAALIFFSDRVQALREMARVMRRDGTIAIAVPGRLEASEGYAALHEVVARHAGPEAVKLLGAYFVLGDPEELVRLVEAAGVTVSRITSRVGYVRTASIDDFVTTEVEATPLVERIDEDAYRRIRADSRIALDRFRTDEVGAAIPIEAHIVTARR